MLIQILFFFIGLLLLIKGSDFFVSAISRIAKRLGVSEFIIGLTLVAIATSLPELANALTASFKGYNQIVIGNIVGSNIINLSLILGISAIVGTLKITPEILRRDGYIMVFVAFVFYALCLGGRINRIEAILLLVLYFAYVMFLLKSKKIFQEYNFNEFLDYFMKFQYIETWKEMTTKQRQGKKIDDHIKKKTTFKRGMIKDIVICVAAFFAITKGSDLLVDQAVLLASKFNLSQNLIAMTIIATGTTLPELTVSVTAARKGFSNMAIGNLIGSNIANILFIIGIAGLIRPITIIQSQMLYTIPFMLFISSLALFIIKQDDKVTKKEGMILIAVYTCFMAATFFFKF